MPIFDQGYQHWHGTLSGHAGRWLTVTRSGVRSQLRNRWPLLWILAAWVPALGLAAVLIVWGLFEQKSSFIMSWLGFLRNLPAEMLSDPKQFRVFVWTWSYAIFFQLEIFFSMVLLILIGPGIISRDLRFNAMPLYFSRPLRRIDYFGGKLGILAAYLSAVTLVPALLAYVLGIFFSMDFSIVLDTGRLLGAVVLYCLVIIVSAGVLQLALSSLTRSSLYVGIVWAGMWILSNVTAAVMGAAVRRNWCPLFSYTRNLERMGDALLGTQQATERLLQIFNPHPRGPTGPPPGFSTTYPWYWSAAVLAVLLGISVWILNSRVKSLDRLK